MDMSGLSTKPTGRGEVWGLGLLVLLAAALRLAGLDQQIVGGDEIHPLKVLRVNSLGDILTHFHRPDNCIPITAWSWLLAATVGLEEWGFRLLSWLPGILLVWILPRAMRPVLAPAEGLLLATVLATSPVLVYWSREARPYSAVAFLAALAVFALTRHAGGHGRRWLVACALCQFAAFAFSPTAAPALAGLALATVVWSWFAARPQPARRRAAACLRNLAPAILALVLVLVLLGPALSALADSWGTGKMTQSKVKARTLEMSARLIFGIPATARDPWVVLGLLKLLTLWGFVGLLRRYPRLGVAALLCALVPALIYGFTRLHHIRSNLVFVRYQAAVVPLYLSLTVFGFGDLRRRLAEYGPRLARFLSPVAFVAWGILTWLGPIPTGLPPHSPFGLRESHMTQRFSPATVSTIDRAPAFYRDLALKPPRSVIEWPVPDLSDKAVAFYQFVHGGQAVACRVLRPSERKARPGADRLRFRTFLWEDAMLERIPPDAVVVLHRQPEVEAAYLHSGRMGNKPESAALQVRLRECRKQLGEPIYEDKWIVVFEAR